MSSQFYFVGATCGCACLCVIICTGWSVCVCSCASGRLILLALSALSHGKNVQHCFLLWACPPVLLLVHRWLCASCGLVARFASSLTHVLTWHVHCHTVCVLLVDAMTLLEAANSNLTLAAGMTSAIGHCRPTPVCVTHTCDTASPNLRLSVHTVPHLCACGRHDMWTPCPTLLQDALHHVW